MTKKINKVFIIALLPFAFFMMTSHRGANYSKPEGWNLEEMNLVDGIYQGESTGFREGLAVEVTVSNGVLAEVAVIDHNEVGAQFYKRPIDLVPGRILEEQNTEVDGVTGATATSMGIMSAVEDALEKAAK